MTKTSYFKLGSRWFQCQYVRIGVRPDKKEVWQKVYGSERPVDDLEVLNALKRKERKGDE